MYWHLDVAMVMFLHGSMQYSYHTVCCHRASEFLHMLVLQIILNPPPPTVESLLEDQGDGKDGKGKGKPDPKKDAKGKGVCTTHGTVQLRFHQPHSTYQPTMVVVMWSPL